MIGDERERVRAMLGATGSGKTHKLAELLKSRPRVILVDPMRDVKNFQDFGSPIATMAEAIERTKGPRFRIRWSGSQVALMFEGLCWLAMQRGNVVLAIDEVQFFVRKSAAGIPKYFQQCCLAGRHENVSVFCTSQRPALTHNDFLSQVQRWYVFRMNSPGDVDAIKRIVPGVEQTLKFSKVGECLTFPCPRSVVESAS